MTRRLVLKLPQLRLSPFKLLTTKPALFQTHLEKLTEGISMKTLKLRYQGTKKKHTLSLNDVNENLDDATVRAAMNEIKEAALIQKDNEVYYVKPLSANYTETIVTPIFDDTEVTVEE